MWDRIELSFHDNTISTSDLAVFKQRRYLIDSVYINEVQGIFLCSFFNIAYNLVCAWRVNVNRYRCETSRECEEGE